MTATVERPAPVAVRFPSLEDRRRARRHRRRNVALAAAAVVVLALGATAVGVTRARTAGATGYRTSAVERHDVTSSITNVATIEPTAQAAVAFPASGTVATVSVKVGDTVTAGQQLATIDPSSLDAKVTAAEAVLTKAQLRLTEAETASTTASTTTTVTGGGSTSGASGGAAPSGSSAGSAPSGSSSTGSASSVTEATQAVTEAEQALAVARQARAQATLVAPIAGRVEAVTLTIGQSVSSGSTSDRIVIAGSDELEAVTSVTVDQVPKVKVGAIVTVVPDGGRTALTGQVREVAVAPTTSSTGTSTYRVVIGFDPPVTDLGNGSTATATIATGSATDVVVVPTSAVTRNGTLATVAVVDGETIATTRVQVGVVGEQWTEITSGLQVGQTVALADLGQALPSSATDAANANRRGVGGANGFPGGGGPPSFVGGGGNGFPGGGPPSGGPGGGGGGGGR